MDGRISFSAVKRQVLQALAEGAFVHATRRNRAIKNLLDTGALTREDVAGILRRSRGNEHVCAPDHRDASVYVHVVRSGGWYLKFVMANDYVEFLSVHRSEDS